MIIDEAYRILKSAFLLKHPDLKIDEVRVGVNLTAVKLSNHRLGLASTLKDIYVYSDKSMRDYGSFTPLRIEGMKVTELFETTKKSALISTLRIAVLNAITTEILDSGQYHIVRNTDPFEMIRLLPNQTVTIVGAFHSYIKKVAALGNPLHVLELNPDALNHEHKQFYVPANGFRTVIPNSDVIIITGLTLVNGTLDGLLSVVSPKSQVVVTGPSSCIMPEVLFSHRVDIIGATYITKPELLFPMVSQAATGFHLFEYCAEKVCILAK